MCDKTKYNPFNLIGKDMDVLAVVGDKESNVQIDSGYGKIIGISIGESYTRPQLGQVNLTLKVDGKERLINVPLTQLLPDGERQMWPIEFNAGTACMAKLTIRVAGLVVATPIPLIFHLEKGKCDNLKL